MKKLFWMLVIGGILFLFYWNGHPELFSGPKTFIKMYEGSAAVYYTGPAGFKEYLGTLQPGESIRVLPTSAGPFASINIMRWMVPRAVTSFKIVIGRFSRKQPPGEYRHYFKQDEYDRYITSRVRTRFWPDLEIKLSPDGYAGTATLKTPFFELPVYSSGIVGVDKQNYGRMYVKFYDVGIGNFHFPRFVLDAMENASNAVMNQGTYVIEILEMDYRVGGIDILYRKTETLPEDEIEESAAQGAPSAFGEKATEKELKGSETKEEV